MDVTRQPIDQTEHDAPHAPHGSGASCGSNSCSRAKRKPRIPEPPPRDISEIPDWLLGGG
jgi:hypothetical protein